jgi:hypothetical protein
MIIQDRVLTRGSNKNYYYINISQEEARGFANKFEFYPTPNTEKVENHKKDIQARKDYQKAMVGTMEDKQRFIDTSTHPLTKKVVVNHRLVIKDNLENMRQKFVTFQLNEVRKKQRIKTREGMERECKQLLRKMFVTTNEEIERMAQVPFVSNQYKHEIRMTHRAKHAFIDYQNRNFYTTTGQTLYNLLMTAKTYSRATLSKAYKDTEQGLRTESNQIGKQTLYISEVEYLIDKLLYIVLVDLELEQNVLKRRPDILIKALCDLTTS